MRLVVSFAFIILWLPVQSQVWQALGGGLNNAVHGLCADTASGKLYAVGQFYFADTNNLQVNNISVWDGAKWDTLCYGVLHPWQTFAVYEYQNEIYSGGRFFASTNNGGKFNGTCWDSLGLGVDGPIYDFYELNNQLYVAGYFTSAGGIPSALLAIWDGSNWTGTNCPFQGYGSVVRDFNGLIYLGGNIYDGTIGNIDIVSWDGFVFSPVGGGILGGVSDVNALAVYHGELYVGGYFTTGAGNAGNHVMKWDGNSWSGVGGGVNNEVYCLAVYNDELYMGGAFTQVGGQGINFLAKWNGIAWTPATSSVIQGPGSVNAIAFAGNTMYIGGGITQIDTMVCNNIAKYTFPTGIIQSSESLFSLYPNPSCSFITIKEDKVGLNASSYTISNMLGEVIITSAVNFKDSEFTIDVSQLPQGIYFLELHSKDEILGIRKIIKL